MGDYKPDYTVHPIDIIQERCMWRWLMHRGLWEDEIEPIERLEMTEHIAEKLADAVGNKPEFWMKMQEDYKEAECQ